MLIIIVTFMIVFYFVCICFVFVWQHYGEPIDSNLVLSTFFHVYLLFIIYTYFIFFSIRFFTVVCVIVSAL